MKIFISFFSLACGVVCVCVFACVSLSFLFFLGCVESEDDDNNSLNLIFFTPRLCCFEFVEPDYKKRSKTHIQV